MCVGIGGRLELWSAGLRLVLLGWQEVHRFLLQDRNGMSLTDDAKSQVKRLVHCALMGTPLPVEPQAPAPAPRASSEMALSEQLSTVVSLASQPQYASKPAAAHASLKANAMVTNGLGTALAPNLSGWNRKW
mmetsp:Transcript_18213/g.51019  ORF Transcript_18213/g.51019 Transcript_18213/m.51019 type:complete len:132 (-) Transcript_18213:303-698(-)